MCGPLLQSQHRIALCRYAKRQPPTPGGSNATLTNVNILLEHLHKTASQVTTVTSDDGLLSITALLPHDHRLYIELHPDRSLEAAISCSRNHAKDLPATTIQELIQIDLLNTSNVS